LQQSSNLTFDNVTGLLTVTGGLTVNGGTTIPHIRGNALRISNTANGAIGSLRLGSVNNIEGDLGMFTFLNDTTRLVRFFSNGNVGINQFTDAGFRLDVNGTARVSGLLRAEGAIQYGTNANVLIGSTINGSSFANGPAFIYGSANINTSTIYAHTFFTGSFSATSSSQGIITTSGATFNPTSGTAVFNAFNLPFTINQTGGANGITRGLFVNPTLTAAADFRAIETSTGKVIFGGTGNFLIGTTTDAGFRLDVNGTARVNSTATTGLTITQGASGDGIVIQNGGYIQMASTRFRAFSSAFQFQDISYNTRVNLSMSGFSYFNSGGNYTFGSLTEVTSAIVNVDSTTKGFLPPRMTTTQKNAIASPATGLQIYDTTLNRPCFYDGTTWITL